MVDRFLTAEVGMVGGEKETRRLRCALLVHMEHYAASRGRKRVHGRSSCSESGEPGPGQREAEMRCRWVVPVPASVGRQ